MRDFDVLCVGHACYDLIFAVDHHPAADEKARASAFINCGGGTAANAAMTAAMLGYRTAFAGYLGRDIYGDEHLAEFHGAGVDTALVVQGTASTPISAIFVKPNGDRSIVNYKGDTIGFCCTDCQTKFLAMDESERDAALIKARKN